MQNVSGPHCWHHRVHIDSWTSSVYGHVGSLLHQETPNWVCLSPFQFPRGNWTNIHVCTIVANGTNLIVRSLSEQCMIKPSLQLGYAWRWNTLEAQELITISTHCHLTWNEIRHHVHSPEHHVAFITNVQILSVAYPQLACCALTWSWFVKMTTWWPQNSIL